jgi:transcriptional regulator with XRE-family HTH domain
MAAALTTLWMESPPMKKPPNPVDQHVGARVRMRRIHLGLSQEKLGEALGITFQQIQKYEKGANRIGASRLQHAAKVLTVPVNYFFEGTPQDEPGVAGFAEAGSPAYGAPPHTDADEASLLAAFRRVVEPQLRTRIIELVEAMSSRAGS